MLGQCRHGLLHLLGKGQQLLAKSRQAITAGVALHQCLPHAPLQFGQPALHGGLVDLQRAAGCRGALVARHRQQVFQVVPVKHGG